MDAEIRAPFVENPELKYVLPLKSAVCQNIAMHALSTARNFFLVLISIFLVHSLFSFFSPKHYLWLTWILVLILEIKKVTLLKVTSN